MLEGRLAELRDTIQPRWTEGRAADVREALRRRGRRHRIVRGSAAALVAGTLAVLAILVYGGERMPRGSLAAGGGSPSSAPLDHSGDTPNPPGHLGDTPNPPGHLGDTPNPPGSLAVTTATPLDAESELVADPAGEGRSFSLRKGGARFVVAHDEAHPFRVHVGSLIVEDVGTRFTVRRVSDVQVEVAVDEGRVRVLLGNQASELGPGLRRAFDLPAPNADDAPDAGSTEEDDRGKPSTVRVPHPSPIPAWRRLTESGRYGEAYESLRRGGKGAVRDETQELLLAADAARLSGHPAEAVPFLEQVLASHGGDQRAGLAAFTLGRVDLDELGRPFDAAQAFDRARRAGGPLAEDALAREVEAFSRAGDTTRAHDLAVEYERIYPQGRRTSKVSKFGGVE